MMGRKEFSELYIMAPLPLGVNTKIKSISLGKDDVTCIRKVGDVYFVIYGDDGRIENYYSCGGSNFCFTSHKELHEYLDKLEAQCKS